ncbi:MAG: exonuclease domain-containing protein [Saprospiraceae bacterium]|nr:exonuclease domain-containing protein [Saprospiraceae bacterium]MDW8484209.1 exonuclease domain-containing protein [Saprospiraceae bacterium]
MYAIVDVETTGGSARYERVIEIAIVLYDGRRIVDTFSTLLYPERSIPWNITRVTGITDEMVANAPRFFEVARRIVEMTREAIFVAHNVSFDYGFLREEFARLGYTYTCRQRLCTVRLARKVFPGLPSYSLDHLRVHFGIDSGRSHRALDDALATTQLLERILATQQGQQNIRSFIHQGVQASRLPEGISLECLHEAPEACGVYYLHDAQGDVVYVGKSVDIRKRLLEHFADTSPKGEKLRAGVADFSYEVTGSELVALLLESAEIKRLQPRLNRALRTRQFMAAIYTYTDECGYRRLVVGRMRRRLRPSLECIVELPRLSNARNWLRSVAQRFELCYKLCHLEDSTGACFHYAMHRCAGACVGAEPPEAYNRRVERAISALSRGLSGSFVLIEPGRTPEERAMIVVLRGVFAGYAYCSANEQLSLSDVLGLARVPYKDLDAARIIRSYMEQHNGTLNVVPLEI